MDKLNELISLDGKLGPANSISKADQAQLIESVLDQWQAPVKTSGSKRHTTGLRAASYALAVILASSTGATAAWVYYERERDPVDQTQTEVIASVAEAPLQAPSSIPAPVIVPETPVSPAVVTPKKRKVKRKPKVKAEDLLKQANELRRIQDWQRAARAYAMVATKFPSSNSEYVALVSEAEIRLKHLGEIDRAMNCYSRALKLRPSGILAAEILFGLSQVYRANENVDKEIEVLQRLLRQYEQSPFAQVARQRLEKL